MDNDELGVVLRRSSKANLPYVAIVGQANGEMRTPPLLHSTARSAPHIRSALPTSSIRIQLNHLAVLQLGAHSLAD
jgi:hypothetical protein